MNQLGSTTRLSRRSIIISIGGLAAVIIIAFCVWYYFLAPKKDEAKSNQETVQRLTAEVGNHFMLPEGEPTIVEVQDKEKLKGQIFYEKVENGDYVLVYEKDKLAIIYRERINKIINAGRITLDTETSVTPQP